MELSLSLEKLNFGKLRELHDVADKSGDAQFSDFVEDMLADQVSHVETMSFYLSYAVFCRQPRFDGLLFVFGKLHVWLSCTHLGLCMDPRGMLVAFVACLQFSSCNCVLPMLLCTIESSSWWYRLEVMCSFSIIAMQAKEVKQVSDFVAQLRRIGKGHGVFHFDKILAEDAMRLATPSSQYGA